MGVRPRGHQAKEEAEWPGCGEELVNSRLSGRVVGACGHGEGEVLVLEATMRHLEQGQLREGLEAGYVLLGVFVKLRSDLTFL